MNTGLHYPSYHYIGQDGQPVPAGPPVAVPPMRDAEAISASKALATQTSPEAQSQVYQIWRDTDGGKKAYNKEAYKYAAVAAGAGLLGGLVLSMIFKKH